MSKPPPIQERIRAAMRDGTRDYFKVLSRTFPAEQFPRAFRYQSNGGPPGCAMAFASALRAMGLMDLDRRREGGGRNIVEKSK